MSNLFLALLLSITSATNRYPSSLPLTITIMEVQAQPALEREDDLPFDNSTWLGKIFNWAARLFLWFIYITILMIALAVTHWFITAKSFWSWIVCFGGVFMYGMLLGRYWGYGTCLIIFTIVFISLKIYFTVINSTKTKSIMDLLVKWNPFQTDTRKNPEERLPQNTGNYNKDEDS